MKFNSEISYPMWILIAVFFVSMAIFGLIRRDFIFVLAIGVSAILPLSIFLRTYYFIQDQTLHVVSGFLYRKQVPIQSITRIEPTRNWISSPALSMNRIEIHTGKFDSVILSPEQQQTFIQTLVSMNPAIDVKPV